MHLLNSALSTPLSNSLPTQDAYIIAQYSNNNDYYEDDVYDRGTSPGGGSFTAPSTSSNGGSRRRSSKNPKVASSDGLTMFQNQKQVGAALLGFGLLFTVMGMMLFFEGNLLRLGNILIIAGVPLLVGPNRVRQFFSRPSRLQATIITSIGILLVFWGKPRLALARRMPILSSLVDAIEGVSGGGKRSRSSRSRGGYSDDDRAYNAPRRREPKRSYNPDF